MSRDDRLLNSSADRPVFVGPYALLGVIGRGGMANVFRARHEAYPTRPMAFKCVRGDLVKQKQFREMFDREIAVASLLDHPSIVKTWDAGERDGYLYLAMEYIGGKDLKDVVKHLRSVQRDLPLPHALYIVSSAARALHYTHSLKNESGRALNIVNRDVSPANIRLSFTGDIKLIDFGIAQAATQYSSEIGVLKGKYPYMSPEQVRGLPLTSSSDTYSLGLVLYELVARRRLFRGHSEFEVMEAVRQAKFIPPSEFRPALPAAVDELLRVALCRDSSGRYGSADKFADDIDILLSQYQFQPAELSDYLKTSFPADYREHRHSLNLWSETEVMPVPHAPVERGGSFSRWIKRYLPKSRPKKTDIQ